MILYIQIKRLKKQEGVIHMKKIEYWNVKEYASEEDKKACEKAWDKEIELKTDKFGRVFDEGGT